MRNGSVGHRVFVLFISEQRSYDYCNMDFYIPQILSDYRWKLHRQQIWTLDLGMSRIVVLGSFLFNDHHFENFESPVIYTKQFCFALHETLNFSKTWDKTVFPMILWFLLFMCSSKCKFVKIICLIEVSLK